MGAVPLVFTAEQMVNHFLNEGDPTPDELETALSRLGRNSGPALLVDLMAEGLLTADTAAACVPSAWCGCEWPNRTLDDDLWRRLFDLAGYTVEGVPAERPMGALRLYRGALPAHRRGWSWTDDRELAQWFGGRPHNGGSGMVWTASVTPGRLLARISREREGESEHVVDARGLRVVAAQRRSC
ncbi:MAG: hypothetical protein M3Q27_13285 [Actinomycetota bacterium]|nr:hypothetical protein [Actinomycetota bacterium]